MTFIPYAKIHRLGKEEVEDILLGHCFIQEKIDGANTSIWLEDGVIMKGSRTQARGDSFNGFSEYVDAHEGIQRMLQENPDYRLYGEWLFRHTVQYKETAYKKFYLFDIMFGYKMLSIDEVHAEAIKYGIDTPKLHGYVKNPTIELLNELAGQSVLGEKGEGIVIKNMDFINTFGRCDYAKLVTEKFREMNAITFGGNNKHSDGYWELYVVNKYITLGRVEKICNKLQPIINERLDMKHIPRIINTVYNDMLTEEIWAIQKKVPVLNFRRLKRLVMLKAKQIYCDILADDISVADKPNDEEREKQVVLQKEQG